MKILLATLFTFLFSATVYAENLPGGFILQLKKIRLFGRPMKMGSSKPPYTEILASQEFMWSAIFFLQE